MGWISVPLNHGISPKYLPYYKAVPYPLFHVSFSSDTKFEYLNPTEQGVIAGKVGKIYSVDSH